MDDGKEYRSMLEELKRKRLSWSEIFSMTKEVYGQNKRTIFLVSLVVLTPLYIFQTWVLNQAMMGLGNVYTTDMIAEQLLENEGMFPYFLFTFVSALVALVVTPLAIVAIIHGTEKIIKKEPTTPKENLLFSFSRAASVVFTEFLVAVANFCIVFFGVLLLFVAAMIPILGIFLAVGIFFVMLGGIIYLSTCWCFTQQVVAIQEDIGISAIKGSYWAVKPYFWETFGLLLIINIVVQIISWLGNFVMNSLFYASSVAVYFGISVIWNFVFQSIATGFSIIFLTILFCNRVWLNQNTVFANDMADVVNTWNQGAPPEEEKISLEKKEEKTEEEREKKEEETEKTGEEKVSLEKEDKSETP